MHFLLVLLRLVLASLVPAWRDKLALAARADGRIEHRPQNPLTAGWERLWGGGRQDGSQRGRTALSVRAKRAPGRTPRSRSG